MANKIVVIDNYDSFVYVLVQYLGELGAEVEVFRNDTHLSEVIAADPDGVLISPGPGTPQDAGICNEAIEYFAGKVPVLGVCLGHQCIGEVFASKVIRADRLMHGKTSEISHTGIGVFTNLPSPLTATRYHSLVIDNDSLGPDLEITATADGDVIMGCRHTSLDVEGVQFHPESVLTEHGHEMLRNFLNRVDAKALK